MFISKNGMESLFHLVAAKSGSPEVIATANPNFRLACQALVVGEGIVVEVPSGMHVSAIDDI